MERSVAAEEVGTGRLSNAVTRLGSIRQMRMVRDRSASFGSAEAEVDSGAARSLGQFRQGRYVLARSASLSSGNAWQRWRGRFCDDSAPVRRFGRSAVPGSGGATIASVRKGRRGWVRIDMARSEALSIGGSWQIRLGSSRLAEPGCCTNRPGWVSNGRRATVGSAWACAAIGSAETDSTDTARMASLRFGKVRQTWRVRSRRVLVVSALHWTAEMVRTVPVAKAKVCCGWAETLWMLRGIVQGKVRAETQWAAPKRRGRLWNVKAAL